jgi:glycine cleavage system H protein
MGERKYTKSHEWVMLNGDTATIGISDFAQKELGDIVYVELPAVGDDAVAGESLGMIESVKASSDFYSPISGEVIEVNEELEASPELVNQNAYENGWIAKIKISDKAEFDELLDEDDYEALCVEEEH